MGKNIRAFWKFVSSFCTISNEKNSEDPHNKQKRNNEIINVKKSNENEHAKQNNTKRESRNPNSKQIHNRNPPKNEIINIDIDNLNKEKIERKSNENINQFRTKSQQNNISSAYSDKRKTNENKIIRNPPTNEIINNDRLKNKMIERQSNKNTNQSKTNAQIHSRQNKISSANSEQYQQENLEFPQKKIMKRNRNNKENVSDSTRNSKIKPEINDNRNRNINNYDNRGNEEIKTNRNSAIYHQNKNVLLTMNIENAELLENDNKFNSKFRKKINYPEENSFIDSPIIDIIDYPINCDEENQFTNNNNYNQSYIRNEEISENNNEFNSKFRKKINYSEENSFIDSPIISRNDSPINCDEGNNFANNNNNQSYRRNEELSEHSSSSTNENNDKISENNNIHNKCIYKSVLNDSLETIPIDNEPHSLDKHMIGDSLTNNIAVNYPDVNDINDQWNNESLHNNDITSPHIDEKFNANGGENENLLINHGEVHHNSDQDSSASYKSAEQNIPDSFTEFPYEDYNSAENNIVITRSDTISSTSIDDHREHNEKDQKETLFSESLNNDQDECHMIKENIQQIEENSVEFTEKDLESKNCVHHDTNLHAVPISESKDEDPSHITENENRKSLDDNVVEFTEEYLESQQEALISQSKDEKNENSKPIIDNANELSEDYLKRFSILSTLSDDISFGVRRGFENPKGFCFLNSVIQVLRSCKKFNSGILKYHKNSKIEVTKEKNEEKIIFVIHFCTLLHNLKNKENIDDQMKEIQNYFSSSSTGDDVNKCFMNLLTIINDVTKEPRPSEISKLDANNKFQSFRNNNYGFLFDCFYGQFLIKMTCEICKADFNEKFQLFKCLALPVPETDQVVRLKTCINTFFMKSAVDIDEPMKCNCPNGTRDISSKCEITHCPQYLFIYLDRGSIILEGVKKNTFIKCSEYISINTVYGKVKYKLISVIDHLGTNENGHYYCKCNYEEDNWWLLNDSQATSLGKCDIGGIVTKNAIVFMFKKANEK